MSRVVSLAIVIFLAVWVIYKIRQEGFATCACPEGVKKTDTLRLNPFYYPYSATSCIDGRVSAPVAPRVSTASGNETPVKKLCGKDSVALCETDGGLPESFPAYLNLTSKAVPDHVLLTN